MGSDWQPEKDILHIEENLSDDNIENQVDSSWLLSQCYLVFFMQAGFGMLETGMARAKNTRNIIIKNLLISAVGILVYWSVGYGFSFGRAENPRYINGFIGTGNFFLSHFADFDFWLIQWTYCATAITIPTSAIMERASFFVYIVHAAVTGIICYPIITHWIWSPDGWLFLMGGIDFGGGACVHLVAGTMSLMGAIVIRPRLGRFDAETKEPIALAPHNMTLSALGTFILWYAWYAYTSSSSYGITHGRWDMNARTAVVTTLSGATSMITTVLIKRYQTYKYDLVYCIYGLLAGLVAITSPAALVETYMAAIIGLIAGIVYVAWRTIILRFKIDDPIDAISIHLGCGIWSVVSVGLFSTNKNMQHVYGSRNVTYGLLYGGGFHQIGMQLLTVVVTIAFIGLISFAVFYLLQKFHRLRIDPDTELAGLDNADHGGSAYAF